MHNSAQLRCFENGNDDFGVEAFWIGDAARVGYFVPLNGPLNGYPPSNFLHAQTMASAILFESRTTILYWLQSSITGSAFRGFILILQKNSMLEDTKIFRSKMGALTCIAYLLAVSPSWS